MIRLINMLNRIVMVKTRNKITRKLLKNNVYKRMTTKAVFIIIT